MPLGTPTDNGAAYSGTTTVAPLYPTGIAANDVVLLIIGQKPSTANGGTVTTPAGWTLRESITGQGGYGTTLGADTGNTNLFIYSKDTVTGTETGTLTVTVGTNNVCWAVIVRIPTAGPGATFSYGTADGSRATAPTSGTAFTVTLTNGTTAPNLQAGDMAIWAMCIPTDVLTAGFTVPTLTSTGTTFGTGVKLEEPDDGTNNDIGGYVAYAAATAGTSTAAPTVGITATGTVTNVRGPIALIRVRETLPTITGTMAATETGADTFAATGSVAFPTITGTLAAVETGADTLAATGTVAFPTITGTLAATETGEDAAAFTGNVLVTGSLTATESGSDVLAATGTVAFQTISGNLAATETGADAFAGSGVVVVRGALAATEDGADTLTATGAVIVAGTLEAAEIGSDVLSASGTVAFPTITGTLAATETGTDSLTSVGQVIVAGALATTESGADTLAAFGAVAVDGALAAVETGADTFEATGIVAFPSITGTMAAAEFGADAMAAAGVVIVAGTMAAVETGSDSLVAVGVVPVAGVATSSLTIGVAATMENTSAVTAVITILQGVEATATSAVRASGTATLVVGTAADGRVFTTAAAAASIALETAASGSVLTVGTATAGLQLGTSASLVVTTRAIGTANLVIGTAAAAAVQITATGSGTLTVGVESSGIKFGAVANIPLTIGVTAACLIPVAVGVAQTTAVDRVTITGQRFGLATQVGNVTGAARISVAPVRQETQYLRVSIAASDVTARVSGVLSIQPQ